MRGLSDRALMLLRAEYFAAIAAIDRELAERVNEQTPAPAVYTTARGGTLPPGWSRRRFREHAARMGAVRTGPARGRHVVYTITREAFEAYVARHAEPPRMLTATSADDQARDWMARSDDPRVTRRARRTA